MGVMLRCRSFGVWSACLTAFVICLPAVAGAENSDRLGIEGLLPLAVTSKVAPLAPPLATGTNDVDWLQGLTMPDFEMRLATPVVEQLERIKSPGWWNNTMGRWIARSGRYRQMIRRVLREEGVPQDLLYVAMIESSFNPSARSGAGAAGLWQFMPATGREKGLRRNRWVDQRHDPIRSTRAAARTLKRLHRRLGTWELAFAAYNMGYYGLISQIRRYNSNDYWLLRSYEYALPSETRNYVPRILAAAIVANNLERFGYGDLEFEEARSSEILEVARSTTLGRLARLLGVGRDELVELNPELRRGRTPPGSEPYELRVPVGSARRAAGKLRGTRRRSENTKEHTIRLGEDLEAVAKQYGVSRRRLARLNEISPREDLEPGTVLLLPGSAKIAESESSSSEPVVSVVPARRFVYRNRRRVFYQCVRGDTLRRISTAFEVTPAEIAMWNTIEPDAELLPGMVIQLFVSTGFDRWDEVRYVPESRVRLFLSKTREFYEEMAERRDLRRIVHRVKRGETLRRLSRRYGLGVGSIARINHFERRHEVEPGDEVVLYVAPRRVPRRRRRRAARATKRRPARAAKVLAKVDNRPSKSEASRVVGDMASRGSSKVASEVSASTDTDAGPASIADSDAADGGSSDADVGVVDAEARRDAAVVVDAAVVEDAAVGADASVGADTSGGTDASVGADASGSTDSGRSVEESGQLADVGEE